MTAVPATDRQSLPEGLARLGLPVPRLAPRLEAYLDLLERWNRAYNLTAVRRREEMVWRHLLDSLVILPFLGSGPLADLGSGAGLPGIPLALARPDLAVTLIEANGKKARFLREAVRRLGVERVRVAECRAEELDEPGAYGCLVARAFGTLAELLHAGGHLLGSSGRLLAMKGRPPAEELAGLPPGWRVEAVQRLDVPGLSAQRHLVIIGREGETEATGDGAPTP